MHRGRPRGWPSLVLGEVGDGGGLELVDGVEKMVLLVLKFLVLG
jgi:hypothetical protein